MVLPRLVNGVYDAYTNKLDATSPSAYCTWLGQSDATVCKHRKICNIMTTYV
jgi:hemolysin-activating ACP:hemolysin acyltransferase